MSKAWLECPGDHDGDFGLNMPIPKVHLGDHDGGGLYVFCPLCDPVIGKTMQKDTYLNQFFVILHMLGHHSLTSLGKLGYKMKHLRLLAGAAALNNKKRQGYGASNTFPYLHEHSFNELYPYLEKVHPLMTPYVIDQLIVKATDILSYTPWSQPWDNQPAVHPCWLEGEPANPIHVQQLGTRGIYLIDAMLHETSPLMEIPTSGKFKINSVGLQKTILMVERNYKCYFSYKMWTAEFIFRNSLHWDIVFNAKCQQRRQGQLPIKNIFRSREGTYIIQYGDCGKSLKQYLVEPKALIHYEQSTAPSRRQ